jgi:hypothetical protein
VRRALTEQTVLRAVIREIISEAPYQSSQRVQLGQVRFKGPSLKGLLIATGVVGLIGLYDWLEGRCEPTEMTFPIKLSKAAAETLAGIRTPTKENTAQAFNNYKDTLLKDDELRKDGTNPVADGSNSDMVKQQILFAKAKAATAAWPKGSTTFEQTTTSNVITAINDLYSTFAGPGCNQVFRYEATASDEDKIKGMPLQTRSDYISFINNVVDVAHSTFIEGMNDQKQKLIPVDAVNVRNGEISKFIDGRLKAEKTLYDKVKPTLN